VKLSLCLTKHHAMMTYWGSDGIIASRILNRGTRRDSHKHCGGSHTGSRACTHVTEVPVSSGNRSVTDTSLPAPSLGQGRQAVLHS
jgi:hypothetical protein